MKLSIALFACLLCGLLFFPADAARDVTDTIKLAVDIRPVTNRYSGASAVERLVRNATGDAEFWRQLQVALVIAFSVDDLIESASRDAESALSLRERLKKAREDVPTPTPTPTPRARTEADEPQRVGMLSSDFLIATTPEIGSDEWRSSMLKRLNEITPVMTPEDWNRL